MLSPAKPSDLHQGGRPLLQWAIETFSPSGNQGRSLTWIFWFLRTRDGRIGSPSLLHVLRVADKRRCNTPQIQRPDMYTHRVRISWPLLSKELVEFPFTLDPRSLTGFRHIVVAETDGAYRKNPELFLGSHRR